MMEVTQEMKDELREAKALFEGSVQAEMPRYKCHKEVWALRIYKIVRDCDVAQAEGRETDGSATITPEEKGYAPFKVDAAYMRKHNPSVGDYFVVYADGYKSCSPWKAFENGYTRIGG